MNQVLTDHETHSNTIMVHFCGPQQLSELLEKLVNFFWTNTLAVINHTHFKHLHLIIIRSDYSDLAHSRELERIFDQVD